MHRPFESQQSQVVAQWPAGICRLRVGVEKAENDSHVAVVVVAVVAANAFFDAHERELVGVQREVDVHVGVGLLEAVQAFQKSLDLE